MSRKYDGSPEIDHDSKDVFETSDVEDEVENNDDLSLEKRDSIDETELPSGDARSRFENELVDSQITDFSDRIDTKSSFNTSRLDETVTQKMIRIKRELEEIQILQEMEENKIPEVEVSKLSTLLQKLSTQAKSVETSYIDDFANLKIDKTITPLSINVQSISNRKSDESIELEQRINALETSLGIDAIPSTQTIQGIINDMSRKINIIYNPEYSLENVKKIIGDLNNQTETAISTRKTSRLNSTSDHEGLNLAPGENDMINALYGKMEYFGKISTVVPSILNRLKSLNSLHSDIGSAVQLAQNIDTIITDISTDIVKWDDSLNDINTKLDESQSQFETNKKEIEDWIRQLERKVEGL